MKITFPTLLFVVFLVLKLTHVIDWSWWWISAPLWVIFPIALIYGIAIAVKEAMETPEERAARLCREMARMLRRS